MTDAPKQNPSSQEEIIDSDALMDLDIPLDAEDETFPSAEQTVAADTQTGADDNDMEHFSIDDLPNYDAPREIEEAIPLDIEDDQEATTESEPSPNVSPDTDDESPQEIEEELESLLADWDETDSVDISSDAEKRLQTETVQETATEAPAPSSAAAEPELKAASSKADADDNLTAAANPPADQPIDIPQPPATEDRLMPEATTPTEQNGAKSSMANSIMLTLGLIATLIASGAMWFAFSAKQQASANAVAPQQMQQQINQLKQQLQQSEHDTQQNIEAIEKQLDELTKVVANNTSDQWRQSLSDKRGMRVVQQPHKPIATVKQSIQKTQQTHKKRGVSSSSPLHTQATNKTPDHHASGWVVNILSVETAKDAAQEIDYLKQHGIRAESVAVRVHGKKWLRIRATGFADRRAASKQMASIKRQLAKRHISPWVEPANWINKYRIRAKQPTSKTPTKPAPAKAVTTTKPKIKKTVGTVAAQAPATQKPTTAQQKGATAQSTNSTPTSPYEAAANTKGWVVNIVSMESQKAAENEVVRLRKNDIHAEFVRIPISGKVWYRIRVSGFKTEQEAISYEKFLKEYHGINAWHVNMR